MSPSKAAALATVKQTKPAEQRQTALEFLADVSPDPTPIGTYQLVVVPAIGTAAKSRVLRINTRTGAVDDLLMTRLKVDATGGNVPFEFWTRLREQEEARQAADDIQDLNRRGLEK